MKKIWFLLFVFGIFLFPAVVFAGKLTATGEIMIENLKPGTTYYMHKIKKDFLKVTNDSNKQMKIKIEVVLPEKQHLRKGFESIPSIKWIKLGKSTLILESGQTEFVRVQICVPKLKKYSKKKYQFHVWSQTVPDKIKGKIPVSAGLESIYLITTK